ncbi:MAG: Flp pilus assembly complex ATPase component TadA [Candidatus Berkelbacteria bacterium]|nr:MAG: Flp pilus assembly complex ATPase component TadA [Candidatus Berkelbacteria bacterium]QQG51577.1 MAG: Flp pilus assembly complex ATPase component TadA [Candidatus Berkelbacteria bacterium]
MAVTNDIIKKISQKTNQPVFKVRAYLRGLTDIIASGLSEGSKVETDGLGTFKLTRLPERKVVTNFGGKKQTITLEAAVTPDFDVDPVLQNKITTTPKPTAADGPITEQFRISNLHTRESAVQFIELVDKTIPKNVLNLVPEPIARKYQAVPFSLKDKTVYIGMTDPENEEAFNAIRKSSGKIVKAFITTQDDVNHVLDQYSGLQSDLSELVEISEEEDKNQSTKEKVSEEDFAETSPAAKIVASLLKRAVREKASDIHVEPSEEDVVVRFRIDGVLRKVLNLPKEVQPAVISRVKILSSLKIDETRLPQDGRIQILLDGNKIDFRISTLPTVNGEKVVARVLDHSHGVLTLADLGVRGSSFKVLEENLTKAHGMTLITGPTGSGKSTTLYAMIARIKNEAINIITMEDPVEYRMPGVNQSQVNAKINFNFASGLRSILRQDPDVVMVGEIRDKETADIAINAALTGHVVLSSLHTNDSAGALPRLLDMGIEPFLITSSTNAIVAQRLCRKICDKCKQEAPPKPEYQVVISQEIENLPEKEKAEAKSKKSLFVGAGCNACGNSGYKGRIGIFEVMAITEPIRMLTIKRASSTEIMQQAKKDGTISMKQDGILKALDGLTTIEEVWRVTKD